MKEYIAHGSKWTKISEKIKGKNVFSIKNRFFHLANKLAKNSKTEEEIKEYFIYFVHNNKKKETSYMNEPNFIIPFHFPYQCCYNYITKKIF